jgi:hypothetical protein
MTVMPMMCMWSRDIYEVPPMTAINACYDTP